MNFGSDMGKFLTSLNTFRAELIRTVPIQFDSFELSYIEGHHLRIRLGIEGNPGSKNELTLEADGDGQERAFKLKENMTYIIGPEEGLIRATFGLESDVEYSPQEYWGNLSVKSISSDGSGETSIHASFSFGWTTDDGKDMEVRCSKLEIHT